jgi:alanine racemase
MIHLPPSRIEISRRAIEENLNSFQRLVSRTTRIAPVLKCNAYGHGLEEIVSIVRDLVPMICVYDEKEFRKARKAFPGNILILGPLGHIQTLEILPLKPILTVASIEYLKQVEEIATSLNTIVDVHIAIDALFGREGILPHEIPTLFEVLRNCSRTKIKGLWSHFSSADETSKLISLKQLEIFYEIVDGFYSKGFRNFCTHISSSAAATTLTKEVAQTDFVRLGLGLFGLWPSHLTSIIHPEIKISPALSWLSWISQIKELPKDHPVGYKRTYISKVKTKVALVPTGYGHGYPRAASNQAWTIIRGSRCYVIGLVSMNCLMVDVSHLLEVNVGDTVTLIGQDAEEKITADQLAEFSQTINYDIVVRISPEISRILT